MAEDQGESDAVMAAMAHVLAAERDGVVALRQSEIQARELVGEARAEAAAIAARADARISRVHAAYLEKIEAEIARLSATHPVSDEQSGQAPDHGALSAAAERLAAKLTGAA